jgi:hypothetical protein
VKNRSKFIYIIIEGSSKNHSQKESEMLDRGIGAIVNLKPFFLKLI